MQSPLIFSRLYRDHSEQAKTGNEDGDGRKHTDLVTCDPVGYVVLLNVFIHERPFEWSPSIARAKAFSSTKKLRPESIFDVNLSRKG